ncbi:MAG TPA: hypothetical protein VHR72_12960 [Gemmataceae bacterium]|jgi:hypothetical protein|nr:hypothetical protein [Gemmataceae bacterium]
MLPRISRYVFAAVVVAGFFGARVVRAQDLESPLQLTSLEGLVGESDVIVRGVVADIAVDRNWNIVTFDVLETLKGAPAKRISFLLQKFDAGDADLARAKKSKRELVWILKRQPSGTPSEAPDREKTLARHKTDLYASFVPGRPEEPALPFIAIGTKDAAAEADAKTPPLSFLTIDLRLLKTPDEIVAAIRTSVAATQGGEPARPLRSHSIAIPKAMAQGTGFSRSQNLIVMPVDGRLEAFARRLLRSPNEFLSSDTPELRRMLRLEAVKTLRLFPSEQNLTILRDWLDDPMTTESFGGSRGVPRAKLVPSAPRDLRTPRFEVPTQLAKVPEIQFQIPLTKAMQSPLAHLHTSVTIDGIFLLNHKKTDGFIETLRSNRPDLAGLSFAMGDTCRMKQEAGRNFVTALDALRTAESSVPQSGPGPAARVISESVLQQYKTQTAAKKVDPAASVAALMQVLAPEDRQARLGLAKYLDGLNSVESTRALAKLAIFSAESDIRTAAVDALKKRDAKDYTDILAAGLKYPWPDVAERASDAMVKLKRKDLIPRLIEVLEAPDPRAPQDTKVDGKKVTVVRELVRLNHHRNCLLCHAPSTATRETLSKEDLANLEGLTATVPVPSDSMSGYNAPSIPDMLVRIDVTYLRQDFSMKFPVANADPWPEMQRFDFLVRTRAVADPEARALQELLRPRQPDASPYRRSALSALRELTGQDAEPTAAAWRKIAGL